MAIWGLGGGETPSAGDGTLFECRGQGLRPQSFGSKHSCGWGLLVLGGQERQGSGRQWARGKRSAGRGEPDGTRSGGAVEVGALEGRGRSTKVGETNVDV